MTARQLLPLIHMGLTDIRRHKLRSFLTMLGMVFGVGSVVAMLAVGEGASQQALDAIRKLGSQNITSARQAARGRCEGIHDQAA